MVDITGEIQYSHIYLKEIEQSKFDTKIAELKNCKKPRQLY